jgi:hypothetical protein
MGLPEDNHREYDAWWLPARTALTANMKQLLTGLNNSFTALRYFR